MTGSNPFRFWRVLIAPMFAAPLYAADPIEHVPQRLREVFIAKSADQPTDQNYLAFPVVLSVGPDEIWVACKSGRSHATDAGAAIQVFRHMLSTGTTTPIQRLQPRATRLYQMAEFVRLPDGDVALFVDVHEIGWDSRHYRTGIEVYRWDSIRKVFEGPRPLGQVAGITYGYPFDFIVAGKTTWQLAMSFGYLPGGRWSVDVIRSDDSSRSWSFVRNLTEEFGGIHANESAFLRHGDGYLVATRGYDRRARLHRTDADFHVLKQVDLTERYAFINGYLGRPRLFAHDGRTFLLGRNLTAAADKTATSSTGPMRLSLFRFDPETLEVTRHSLLDNAEGRNVTDGYYAMSVFSKHNSETLLHVVTYKAIDRQPPDIVRLDYPWNEK